MPLSPVKLRPPPLQALKTKGRSGGGLLGRGPRGPEMGTLLSGGGPPGAGRVEGPRVSTFLISLPARSTPSPPIMVTRDTGAEQATVVDVRAPRL